MKPQHVNKPMWKLAMRELEAIERAFSPSSKLSCIFNSFKIINTTFNLFASDDGPSSATADDILNIWPYIVVKANIERIVAHMK
jgi:Vacuolar sorting protein 9 (VPS9) domain